MKIFLLTEVKLSTIHGRGRFSLQDILKGDIVLYIEGPLSNKGNDHKTFINHKSEGNLTYKNGYFYAKRFISKGEELTWDYSEEFSNVEQLLEKQNSSQ